MPLLAPALVMHLSCLLRPRADWGLASAAAFRPSQTVEAASFRRALLTPGADEILGPPHALAAQCASAQADMAAQSFEQNQRPKPDRKPV